MMTLNKNRPSKKIVALAIVAIAFIGSALISKFYKPTPKAISEETQPLSYEVTGTPSLNDYLDEDNDGLKDWEELLWGTKKDVEDSDGDGTNDGDEVKEGRNPAIKGPNDKLENNKEATSTEILTKSDIISRELFSKYINLSESGDTSVESRERLVAEIVEKSKDSFTFPLITLKDLRVLYSPGNTDIEFYASSVAAIQINLLLQLSEQSPTNPDIQKLKSIYESASKSLKDVPTPNEIVYSHLEIMNNYNITASMYSALQNYQKDPITFAIALRTYQESGKTQIENLQKIAKFIRDNGIIFPDGNIGNYWNNF